MATFTIYQRIISASTIRSVEDVFSLVNPTGDEWNSTSRSKLYRMAAVIELETPYTEFFTSEHTLERIFCLTNDDWSDPSVKWHSDHMRSTSKGDVIVDEDGEEWLVKGRGFEHLNPMTQAEAFSQQYEWDDQAENRAAMEEIYQDELNLVNRKMREAVIKHYAISFGSVPNVFEKLFTGTITMGELDEIIACNGW